MAYDIGVQTYTYRAFTVDELVDELAALPIDAVEVTRTHLAFDADRDRVESVLGRFEEAGIDVRGWSAPSPESPETARAVVDFADRAGIEYLNISFDPEDAETIDAMVDAAADRNVLLGIHNHGPGATYETVEDVLAVIEGRPTVLGACVDTGHFFRAGQSPGHVLPRLGERVHGLHVKDFVAGDTEVIPGDGELDIPELFDLLEAHSELTQPLVVEYEADPDDPTPAVETAVDRLLSARPG